MRWHKRPTPVTRAWHRWFAWFPVEVPFQHGERTTDVVVWLEFIERKGTFVGWLDDSQQWSWEYRFTPPRLLNNPRVPKHKYPTIDELRAERRSNRRSTPRCNVCGEPGCPDHGM